MCTVVSLATRSAYPVLSDDMGFEHSNYPVHGHEGAKSAMMVDPAKPRDNLRIGDVPESLSQLNFQMKLRQALECLGLSFGYW